ncbi:MAG: sulfatase, partial [Bacteroidales bacterium]
MKHQNTLILLLLVLASACAKPKTEEAKRPNILFIMSDDHSYQTISAYDNRYINTPNIDALASEGILADRSYVTNSICGPSRAVMLTGKFNHLNGMITNQVTFDASQQTYPSVLGQNGYETAIIGKWHLRSLPQNFNHYEILIGQGNYYNTNFIKDGDTVGSKGYVTDVVTDKSIDWLDNRDKNKPFCLLVHHKAVHRIWMPDTSLLAEFKDVEFPLPANFYDNYEGRKAAAHQQLNIENSMYLDYDLKMLDDEEFKSVHHNAYKNRLEQLNPDVRKAWDAYYQPIIDDLKERKLSGKELTEWKFQRYMQDYLACVRSLDNNIGRLIEHLKEIGEYDNTIIVYTSDQGFYMGEHGWFDKRFMYEESFRTPLVIRIPEALGGEHKVIHDLVQNIDYAPTFLDFAGVKIPEDMQGQSMKPLLTGKQKGEFRDALYYHYYEYPNEHRVMKHYGVRDNRYKLIRFYDPEEFWELYDLEEDPHEMNNLYGKEGYDEITTRMKTKLDELRVK